MSAALFPFTAFFGLFAFSYVVFGESRSPQSNWWKIAMAVAAFGSAINAVDAFESLQSASSRQLLVFVAGILGGIGSWALLLSVKPNQWTLGNLSSNAQTQQVSAPVQAATTAAEKTTSDT